MTRVPRQFFFHINRSVKSVEGSRIQDELHKISGRIYLGPHTLRHAFPITPHLKGVDVYQIMKSLGHEQLSTSEIYLEKVFEREHHAIHLWVGE
ncbi:tyrosine-type recombinase/integrase [Peribacillus frigoritolerans]|uniref:tyrosine-type recombinase/integrase n=1 Tax=Peribacillus frigoritolerans TaxID=450367 RepID=UPI003ECE7C29